MRRRELLSAAVLAAAAARAQDAGVVEAPGRWPGEEKLNRTRRGIAEAMAKVRLQNSDAPDLLPRPRRRGAK